MMSSEPSLVLGAIELLLGGTDSAEQRERRLSDIDWALARHFFDRMLAQLSVIWNDIVGLELDVASWRRTWRPRRWSRSPSRR